MLNEREVAEILAVSLATLHRWRRDEAGPAYHKFGHSVRYDPSDIQEFLAKTKRTPSGGA